MSKENHQLSKVELQAKADQLANKIAMAILRRVLEEDRKDEELRELYKVMTGDGCEHRPGGIYLVYELSSEIAEANLIFVTEGFVDSVFMGCNEHLDKFLSDSTTTTKDGIKKSLADCLPSKVRRSLVNNYTQDAIAMFLHGLKGKMENALDELSQETALIAKTVMYSEVSGALKDAGVIVSESYTAQEEMKRLLADMAAERKAFLKEQLAYVLEPNLEEFAEHYAAVLPIWKDAKIIYKQNSSRATWRDLIRAAYPEHEFDDDLISRLSGKLNDLPEEIQTKLSEKGGDSKPSSIALEHAARLCGTEPYKYSLRYLYYKLKKSSPNGEQNIREEVQQKVL
jgi:hypothetical protein